jgi:predicted transcriptional regulator
VTVGLRKARGDAEIQRHQLSIDASSSVTALPQTSFFRRSLHLPRRALIVVWVDSGSSPTVARISHADAQQMIVREENDP